MLITNEEAERLVLASVNFLRQGQPREARGCLERVTQSGRANVQIWLLLAVACRADNDAEGEEAAVDQLLDLDSRLLRAHIMKGDCRAKAGDDRTALSFYESALLIAGGQQIPADLADELRRVEDWMAKMKRRLDEVREAALTARGVTQEGRSRRFQKSLDILSGAKRIYVQEPTGYYFPELPQIQFYDAACFDWVPALEAAAEDMRKELERLLARGRAGFQPYLKRDPNSPRTDDNHLLDDESWSALFFCENGKLFEDTIAQCPKTWAAVQAAPLPRINNSPTVMFSLLRPGARIAPHTGTHNARLICHLPLIVPPDCSFRVGNEVRTWEQGQLLIFDDTIEHEAWNDSDEDRIVLIFDIWRPELTEQERREIEVFFSCSSLE